jgi:hypothetical protein
MFILTDKGVIAHVKDGNITLTDALNNVVNIDKHEMPSRVLGQYNLSCCFAINVEGITKAKQIEPGNTSLLLQPNEIATFVLWNESILNKLRIIEWLTSQLAYGKTYHHEEISHWIKFNRHDIEIRDCQVGAIDYEHHISELIKKRPALTNAFQLHYELSRLGEIVRFEMAHAESRLREAIQWIILLTSQIKEKPRYEDGGEYVYYGLQADQVGWCITDTVKALSTALDSLSKYTFLTNKVDIETFPPTPSALAGNLRNYKPRGNLVTSDAYETIRRLTDDIKPLIELRHELTHNQALYPIRQPAFIGYRTPCVNNLGIAYGEILWWDIDSDHYSRSCKRTGFFKQRRNAITEATKSFLSTHRLVDAILDFILREIVFRLGEKNFEDITYLEMGSDYKENYPTVSLKSVLSS